MSTQSQVQYTHESDINQTMLLMKYQRDSFS